MNDARDEYDEQNEMIPVEATAMVDRAEVDMQVATARRYPRSIKRFKERVLELATIDQETAEECWYSLPRGGKVIEGPGIRFAEIVAASYGNLRVAARHVRTEEKHVVCEAVCWDLENNVAVKVSNNRRITKRNGERFDDDMVGVTIAANNAICLRNAVFKVVPKAIFQRSLQEVQKIAMGGGRTITETRKAILEHYKSLRVPVSKVLELIGKKGVEDITLEDATTLRGVATAIKEGTTTIAEAFGTERAAPQRGTIPKEAISSGNPEANAGPAAPHKKPAKPRQKKAAGKPKREQDIGELRQLVKDTIVRATAKLSDEVINDEVWMAGLQEGVDASDDRAAMKKLVSKLEELEKASDAAS